MHGPTNPKYDNTVIEVFLYCKYFLEQKLKTVGYL